MTKEQIAKEKLLEKLIQGSDQQFWQRLGTIMTQQIVRNIWERGRQNWQSMLKSFPVTATPNIVEVYDEDTQI